MINYYNQFLPSVAKVLIPLHDAVGNKTKEKKEIITWTPECAAALEEVRKMLADATLLHHLPHQSKLS